MKLLGCFSHYAGRKQFERLVVTDPIPSGSELHLQQICDRHFALYANEAKEEIEQNINALPAKDER